MEHTTPMDANKKTVNINSDLVDSQTVFGQKGNATDLFIAICCDRHIDEVVRVFSTQEKAVEYCKEFIPKRYQIEEQELTKRMISDGWVYFATYSTEGDSVRVEKGTLDPKE